MHYFVGGATKMFGAALYRLRAEDFGEVQYEDGVSPAWPISYDEMEPYYTQAEELYQVHGARGEDPRSPGKRSLSLPGRLPRAAHPAALGRSRRRRLPALPRSCGVMLDEANMPYSACVRCDDWMAFPASCTGSLTPR